MRILTIIMALFLLISVGCREKHDVRLDGLEDLMKTEPDSALAILESFGDSTFAEDFDRARYAMLLMMTRDKCYLPLEPDSTLLWANGIFHTRNDKYNEERSRYYAGLAFRHAGEYRSALWEALNAIDVAESAADTFWIAKAHDLAYEIYSETYDWKNAAIEADLAAIFFKRAGAERFHHYALIEKTIALNNPGDKYTGLPTAEGLPLLDSLINVFRTNGDSVFLETGLSQKSTLLYRLGEIESGKAILDTLLEWSSSKEIYYSGLPVLISDALLHHQDPQPFLKELEKGMNSRQDTLHFLTLKKEIAVTSTDWKTAYLASDSSLRIAEIILGEWVFSPLEEMKVTYTSTIAQNKEEENKRLYRSKIILQILIGILIIVIASGYYHIRRHARKKQRETMNRLMEVIEERENLNQLLAFKESIESENLLLKEKLNMRQKDLDEIQNQLNRLERVAPLTLSLNRENLLSNRIDTLCGLGMEYYGEEDNQKFKNVVFNQIQTELTRLRSEKFRKEFVGKVNAVHADIVERFRKQIPQAKDSDLTWFAMLVAGIQPITISFLLDMKKDTFYSLRRRYKGYIEKSEAPDKEEFLAFFP